MNVSGRKIVASIVSCLEVSSWRTLMSVCCPGSTSPTHTKPLSAPLQMRAAPDCSG